MYIFGYKTTVFIQNLYILGTKLHPKFVHFGEIFPKFVHFGEIFWQKLYF